MLSALTTAQPTTDLRVALYTEGTYPQSHGGVSVWVDQLVRGLPEHTFEVRAITGVPYARPAVELPANVQAMAVPLWGDAPRPAGRTPERTRQITDAFATVAGALCRMDQEAFGAGLHALAVLGRSGGFTAVLDSPRITQLLLDTWRTEAARQRQERDRSAPRLPAPSVADALDVQMWLEHALRPLCSPAPQADIGHAVSNGFAGMLALSGLWTHGTPFVLTEHGVYMRERYLEFRRSAFTPGFKTMLLRFYRLLTTAVYREASLVLPGSQYNRRWEERLGAHPDKIHCVYNGIDPDIFPPAEDEPQESVVSWVGRIDPLKDIETLIRAFDLVRRQRPNARLRLFGGVPSGNEGYAQHCELLTDQLNLRPNVTFEGRVADITDAYRAGQVVALTSVSEGFPYTVIEAMAMGRPPVATRVGGVPEAVGDAGLIVRPRDVMGVASALGRLLDDAPLRARLGRAARERVMDLFTLDGCLVAYRRAYPAAMAGRPA
ncbi:glycosyltransferase involved in cell wall biosynthesis [Deinococcus metalli]|uniref:Glycosyltransferase involved in cell wall biosynthesis n=1 Tax=Deinococcus metalli TaxID=1141878 RepID=A0A7W8NQ85_9DEIO|nr:GT4 family glycosyltransferase PelF [Deinococcus metalli]MBB5375603.1 glycosyltransferase involved in cell wall biosynthesis [Deinococcus metalli]GHF38457.1 lipopolysaccharide glycosyltransferase, putative [Deinococcus metalli]